MQIKNNTVFVNTTKVEPLAACSTFQQSNPRSQGRTTAGRKGWVEYKVPSMGYTDALLKLQYLCLGHRPLTLSVDGEVLSSTFAKASSGGFTESRHLKWTPAERISGLNSEFIVRLETRGSFPNLSCLKLELFNSEEKIDELVKQVQSKISDGIDAEKALAIAGELVEYNQYVDSVPEDRIHKLFSPEGEDQGSDSGESDESTRERRARERADARKAARREMRAKKAALMRAQKDQAADSEVAVESEADKRAREREAAREQAVREMRAKKAALRAQKQEAAKAERAKEAALRQKQIAAARSKHRAELQAKREAAAAARLAEKEAAARKAAEEFELDISAVVDWATSLGEKKLRAFLRNHRDAKDNMEEVDVESVMHTLICVYVKKVKKQRCPPTHVTKKYTSTMLSLVDDYSSTGIFNALMQIEDLEEEEDSNCSGGAQAESDDDLDTALLESRQAADQEAKILAEHAQLVKEQEAARLAEAKEKEEVIELTNALCEELRDLVWDLREAQYFFEMTPGGEETPIHTALSDIEAKIAELGSINTSLIPEIQHKAIQSTMKAREEVGYLKTRFDHRAAGHAREVQEGFATVTSVSTWTDDYVNSIAFEYSDGTKRCWGSDFSGKEKTTDLNGEQIKTVHLWTTKKNRVAEGIKLFATNAVSHEGIGSKAQGMFGLGSPDQKRRTDDAVLELVFSATHTTFLGISDTRKHEVPQGSWLDEAEAYQWDGYVLVAHVAGSEPSRVVPLPRETFKFEDGRMVVEKRLM